MKKAIEIIDMLISDCDCQLGEYDHVEQLEKIKEILTKGETQLGQYGRIFKRTKETINQWRNT